MEQDRFGKLASLVELGFEPMATPAVATEFIPVEGGRIRITLVRPSMGTRVSITAVHTSSWLIEEASGQAFSEMDRLVDLLNRYDDGSAVGVLNQEGHLSGPPPALSRVLDRAADVHALSGGRFDVTVAPVVDLLRDQVGLDGASAPDPMALQAVLDRVGFHGIKRSDTSIQFDRPEMTLTLDGIAKGHIVDAMATVLVAHGLADWLIDAGGDIRAGGGPDPARSWRIAVRDPTGDGLLPGVTELREGAVATSGGYEMFYGPDRSHHHIVDGRTGRSATRNLGATVRAPDTLMADALATSVFLMDPAEGLRFVDTLPGCECLLVDADGHVLRSSGWTSHSLTHADENNP